MAMQRLYTVYDRVAEEAGPIFQAQNDGVAARQYRALLQQVAPVSQDDYWLMCLGEYDPELSTADPNVYPIRPCVPMRIELPGGQLKLIEEATNGEGPFQPQDIRSLK